MNRMLAHQGITGDLMLLVPNSLQRPWTLMDGYVCLYESFFTDSGLWFPLPRLLVEYCVRRKITISQLTHAAIQNMVVILALAAEASFDVDCDSLEEKSRIKRNLGG